LLFLCRLEDEGCQSLLRVLLKNTTVEEVHIGSNNITKKSSPLLAQVNVPDILLLFLFMKNSFMRHWDWRLLAWGVFSL